jgi:hypothetical protein
MRNACFWGREKGFAEKRVQIVRIPMLESATASIGTTPSESGTDSVDKVKPPSLIGGDKASRAVGDNFSVAENAGIWFRDISKGED